MYEGFDRDFADAIEANKQRGNLSPEYVHKRWPDALVRLDHDVPHIVAGEDVRFRAAKARHAGVQVSCAAHGDRYERQLDKIIARREYWLTSRRWTDGELEHMRQTFGGYLNREGLRSIYARFTAMWRPDAGVWVRESYAFPRTPLCDPMDYPTRENEPELVDHDGDPHASKWTTEDEFRRYRGTITFNQISPIWSDVLPSYAADDAANTIALAQDIEQP